MKSLLPVLLFGGLAYLIFSSAKNLVANLSFSILDFGIDKKNTSLNRIAANVTIGIQNDSQNSSQIKRVYLNFYHKGNLIAQTDVNEPFNIKPFTQNKVLFPVNIPTGKFLAAFGYSITDLILGNKNPEIQIKGKIFVTGGAIDIDEIQKLKIV